MFYTLFAIATLIAISCIAWQNRIGLWIDMTTSRLYVKLHDNFTMEKAAAATKKARDREAKLEKRQEAERLARLLLEINKAIKRGRLSTTCSRYAMTTEMREYLLARNFTLTDNTYDVVIEWKLK